MKKVIVGIVGLCLFLTCSIVLAKPHQLTWEWPTTMCPEPGETVGAALAEADLVESELIYNTAAMPMPSDAEGSCAEPGDPGAPAGAAVVPIPVTVTSTILNLQPGETYFARMRVSAYVNGNWSSWSNQVQFTVPYGRPNVIRMSQFLQLTYEEIGVTRVPLSKES